ncbi:MAG TPA: N-6 DNA methylase [Oculatellaceae cyanobacterium]|jgi:type I restriction-modification system DNA methylase subunit
MSLTITEQPLALQAWHALLERYDKTNGSNSTMFHAMLPGIEILTTVHPQAWLAVYEQIYARLSRKARQQGQAQDGVFYTPPRIAEYLIQQTIGKKLQSILQAEDTPKAALQQAQQLLVIDPACGTGVFLVAALKAFHQFYEQLDLPQEAKNQALKTTLQNQIFGVDIDAVAVQITQLQLQQWLYHLAAQSTATIKTLITGDTLLPETFQSLGVTAWSFIVGNPPYISEVRKQSGRFQTLKQNHFYQAKMDLCDAFLAWGIQHTQAGGEIAYVLPEYWTQRTSTQALRQRLLTSGNLQEFWRFKKTGIFKNAPGHHTSLLIWQKTPAQIGMIRGGGVAFGEANSAADLQPHNLQPAQYRLDNFSGKLIFGNPTIMTLLARLEEAPRLLKPHEIQQGIILPQGRLKEPHPDQEIAGVFLLTDTEADRLNLTPAERNLLRPFFMPGSFRSFSGFSNYKPDYWLIYTDAENRKQLETAPEQFPNLARHLQSVSAQNTSAHAPYGLHRARRPIWFEDDEKILCLRQVFQPCFAAVSHPAYVGEGFYSIRCQRLPSQTLTAILNSSLAHFWFYQQKRKGDRLQIDKDVLCSFPQAVNPSPSLLINLNHLANMLQSEPSREQNRHLHRQIDSLVFALYGLSPKEIDFIQREYGNT